MWVILGILITVFFVVYGVAMFMLGGACFAWDAGKRLRGEEPVDKFWADLGMKRFR